MTFTTPAWLLVLALIPLAALAYVYAQRRQRTYAVRFTALSTLREAAEGTRAGWWQHLPLMLALLAIAALALALARPRTSYIVAIRQASIMLVTDHSGSMAADDVSPSRLAAAERAADAFINKLPNGIKVGAVAFSTVPDGVQGPASNHGAALQIIADQQAGGSTATGNALADALELLHAGERKHPPSAIVLLSDGAANAGIDPVTIAREAAKDHIPIDTVALGTANGVVDTGPFSAPQPVPPDPQLMQQIAQASGGRSFDAKSADDLFTIYRNLGKQLGSVTRHHEITPDFAVIALLLLLAAAGLGIRFSGRLP